MNCQVCGKALGARWIDVAIFSPIPIMLDKRDDAGWLTTVTENAARVCSQECRETLERWCDLKNDWHSGRLRA